MASVPRLLVAVAAVAVAAAAVPSANTPMMVWSADALPSNAAPVPIATNAPVLRWESKVDPGGTFGYSVTVSAADGAVWTTGDVWMGNWPVGMPFPGLCVYEGPGLAPQATFSFTVEEWQAADHAGRNATARWSAGSGSFTTVASMPTPKDELIAVLSNNNNTVLWSTSRDSVWQRVEPSGFLPTSVSGGYGGITSEFVRDAAGMMIGMLEIGQERWPTARRAMRFMLEGLQCTQNKVKVPGCELGLGIRRPPEVLNGNCPEAARAAKKCEYNTAFVGVEMNEETDGTFYIIAAWGRIVAVTGDLALEKDFFATLKTYVDYYLAPDAKSDAGVPYFNASLGLLWTPHLEHSRLTQMWAAYDSLTNSFAIEALRYMIVAANRLGKAELAEQWGKFRDGLITGLDTSLKYSGAETGGKPIYAEMLGHVGYANVRDPAPMLFGMSWVQTAVINTLVSNMSNAGGPAAGSPVEALGVDPARLEATFDTYTRFGSFLWINEDASMSAMVQTTNTNSSRLMNPPYVTPNSPTPPPPPPPQPRTSCSAPLTGKAALRIGSGGDMCSPHEGPSLCSAAADAGECCAACTAAGNATCWHWFFNGDDKTCHSHGCCYFKREVHPDTVTTPSPNFAAGYSGAHGPPTPPSPWCNTLSWPFGGSCQPGCPCPARVTIGKGVGWEIAWRTRSESWTRLIAIHRWLGAAHHVEKQPLYGENLDHDCIKAFERGGTTVSPSNGRCWGDPGNGVQIGWFVWAEALLRRKLNLT